MSVKEFIVDYYSNLNCIRKISPYISFGLICAGIEYLGKCLDDIHEFQYYENGLSSKQFYSAITQVMPKYIIFKNLKVYVTLRNGMLHALIPNGNIWLREKHNTQYQHLSEHDILGQKRVVIILEEFYEDFEKACNIVIEKIEIGELKHPKIKMDFLATTE